MNAVLSDTASAGAIVGAVRAGVTSAAAITETVLERIAQTHGRLNAFTTVTGERARAEAAAVDAAVAVGRRVAEKALAVGIERVAFDRSGFKYHGRIKALAEAAREAGLKF